MDVFPKLQSPLLSSSWGAELTYPRKRSPTARPRRTTRRFLYCRFYQIWIQEPSTWEEVEPGVKGTNLSIIFKAWKILIIDESAIYCYVNNYHSSRNLWDFLTGSQDKPTLIHTLNKLLEYKSVFKKRVAQNSRRWKPVTRPFLYRDVGVCRSRGLLPAS